MFKIGDKVVYGSHGVCCVMGSEERTANRKKMTFLVLEPVEKDGTKYMIPIHNASAMGKLRRILTREEMDAMLHSEAVHRSGWIQNENERKQAYRELIGSGNREGLMCMVHTLYGHQASQAAAGRKCHLCDENFLRDAEKLLSSEVSVVMSMEPVQARQYIRDTLCP